MIALAEVWVAALVSPAVLLVVAGVVAYLTKKADWAREDQVAKRVEDAATKLLASDAERIRSITGVTSEIKVLKAGQDEIHEIVNSSRTKMIERIDQLIQALNRAGVDIPADLHPTD